MSNPGTPPIATGEIVQTVRGGEIERRLTLRFANKSVFEETVAFTQRGVFRMTRYRLSQHGPPFRRDLDATLTRDGKYTVKMTSREDGSVSIDTGTIELPPDLYPGMVTTVARNLAEVDTQAVHVVAFLPRPRIFELQIAPAGPDSLRLGTRNTPVRQFVIKPRLGPLITLLAKMKGAKPSDSTMWIDTNDATSFVRLEGTLFTAKVWRVEIRSTAR